MEIIMKNTRLFFGRFLKTALVVGICAGQASFTLKAADIKNEVNALVKAKTKVENAIMNTSDVKAFCELLAKDQDGIKDEMTTIATKYQACSNKENNNKENQLPKNIQVSMKNAIEALMTTIMAKTVNLITADVKKIEKDDEKEHTIDKNSINIDSVANDLKKSIWVKTADDAAKKIIEAIQQSALKDILTAKITTTFKKSAAIPGVINATGAWAKSQYWNAMKEKFRKLKGDMSIDTNIFGLLSSLKSCAQNIMTTIRDMFNNEDIVKNIENMGNKEENLDEIF